MKLAIIDCETDSLDAKTGHLLEVACMTFHVEHATPLRAYSCLVRAPSNEAEKVNRIPSAIVDTDDAQPRENVIKVVRSLATGCDAIVAHNADFDHAWLPELHHFKWVCSCDDIEWPRAGRSKSLVSLCCDHDIPIGRTHRAMADVDMIARLFEWCAGHGHDVKAMIEAAMKPRPVWVAIDEGYSRAQFEERNTMFKEAGFRFDGSTKSWRKRMTSEAAAAVKFPIQQLVA